MASKSFKVSFTLDESDAAYFRKLYRTAKQHSSPEDRPRILKEVSGLIDRVRAAKKVPSFVLEATRTTPFPSRSRTRPWPPSPTSPIPRT